MTCPLKNEHTNDLLLEYAAGRLDKVRVQELEKHITATARPAISMLAKMLADCPWDKESISAAIKEVLRATGIKMPQLAMPVRVLVLGTTQTPSLDAVLALSDRQTVIRRLQAA